MCPLPHIYRVTVEGGPEDLLATRADRLPEIVTAPPGQFGGPGDQWSPESLLVAAVANCMVLTFRAIARASRFEWVSMECETMGTLDSVDRKMRFTTVSTTARLVIPSELKRKEAIRLLEKAEKDCLISNSLTAKRELQYRIEVAEAP